MILLFLGIASQCALFCWWGYLRGQAGEGKRQAANFERSFRMMERAAIYWQYRAFVAEALNKPTEPIKPHDDADWWREERE